MSHKISFECQIEIMTLTRGDRLKSIAEDFLLKPCSKMLFLLTDWWADQHTA